MAGAGDRGKALKEFAARGGLCAETDELLAFIGRKRKSRFGWALNA